MFWNRKKKEEVTEEAAVTDELLSGEQDIPAQKDPSEDRYGIPEPR